MNDHNLFNQRYWLFLGIKLNFSVLNNKCFVKEILKKINNNTYLPTYSSGYGIIYPSGLGLGELPTQKKASGPVPSYAKFFINIVDSSTAYTCPFNPN